MQTFRWQTVIFFLLMIIMVPGMALAATSFSVVFPPEDSYVRHEAINLVLALQKTAVDEVVIKVNEFEYPAMKIPSGNTTFCTGITLASGLNTVIVTGRKGGEKVGEEELALYFSSLIDVKTRKPPREYKEYIFHVAENERNCASCHNMEPGLSDLKPDRPEDSPCYSCHRNKMNSVNLHVPVKKWACFECHEITRGSDRKYAVRQPVSEVCYDCHGQKVSSWKSKKIMHGPTAVGQCTLCHDPHGSDWPAFTRMHPTDMCINCHVDMETGKHVIAGFFGKGHPTRGVPDPFVPGKEFSCAGCHNPHASDYDNILNFGSESGIICNECHKK